MIPAAASSISFMVKHPHEGGFFGCDFRRDRLAEVESVDIDLVVVVRLGAGQERSRQEVGDHAKGATGEVFFRIASLLPGTLLTGFEPDDDHKVYVHGLDVGQPIVAELAAEEASFMRMIDHE